MPKPNRSDPLLVECLRAYPQRPASIDLKRLDAGFWEHARTRGVYVLVAQQLGLQTPEAKAAALAQGVSAMRSEAVTLRLLAICEEMGIRALPLKGPFLAKRLYGDITKRPTSDVDLLVAHADVKRLIARLGKEGAVLPEAIVREYYERAHHHLNVTWLNTLVEIHFRATSDFGVFMHSEPLLERSHMEKVGEHEIRVMDPNDEMIYLAVHAAAHFFALDTLLLDLRLLAQSRAVDWTSVEENARTLQLERAIAAALAAAERRVALPNAREERPSLRLGLATAALLPRGLPVGQANDWPTRLSQYVFSAALCATPRVATNVLAHHWLRAARRRITRLPFPTPSRWRA